MLAVAGAEDPLVLALGRVGHNGPRLLDSLTISCPGRTSGVLTTAVADLLDRSGADLADLQGLACVRGPGSFTGIRICLATALGLMHGSRARGHDLTLAGLDHLDVLARGAGPCGGPLAVITHARRDLVHVRLENAGPDRPGGTRAMGLSAAADLVGDLDAPTVLGSGLRRHQEFFARRLRPEAVILPVDRDVPDPGTLLDAAAAADYAAAPIEPLYLRPSDAEENLETIARSRGLDPAEARKRLSS